MDVVSFLQKQHCAFDRVHHQPAYSAQRVAEALHVSGCEVAKAVLLRADDEHKFFVAVLPADRQVDLQAASRLVGAKVHLASELEVAARCLDDEFDVLPPFGSRFGIRTIVDSSLTQEEDIYFDARTHSEAIRMSFEDYREVEDPLIGPFAAGD